MAGNMYEFNGNHYPYNGIGGGNIDEWSKTTYVEGRKRPVIQYPGNTETYINKADRFVEQAYSPAMIEYKHGHVSPTKFEPVKEYGYGNDEWNRPSSPIRDRDRDRPSKVEDFITKIQTEASRPNMFGALGGNRWRQSPQPTEQHHQHVAANGYGDYSDYGNKEWSKPSGNAYRQDSYDDYFTKKKNSSIERTNGTSGGWAKQTAHSARTSPPAHETPLSRATNDIGMAIEYLKEAATGTTAPNSRYTVPFLAAPKRDGPIETIDSWEAARRYGNFRLASRPYST